MTAAPTCAQCDAPHAAPFQHAQGYEEMLCPECRRSTIEHEGSEAYMTQLFERALTEWFQVYGSDPKFLAGADHEAAHIAREVMSDMLQAR